LVPKSDLVGANSLVMSTNQATMAVSYAVGGILVVQLGFQSVITLDLLSFIAAALITALMVVPRRMGADQLGEKHPSWVRAALDGLAYLRNHRLARPLITMEFLEHWPHGLWTSAMMLAFTQQALRASPEAWGYQNSAFFGGQLVGAMLAVLLAGRLAQWLGWVIIWNAFLFGALTLTYALSPNVPIAVLLCFIFGPPSAIRDVAQDSLLQASVSPDVLGRIYATRQMLANLSFMLAGVGFAWLADQIPVRWVYLVGGCLYLGTAFYALSSVSIRRSRMEVPVGVPAR
jgi:MFS family permease